jgi:hypothetical protein
MCSNCWIDGYQAIVLYDSDLSKFDMDIEIRFSATGADL